MSNLAGKTALITGGGSGIGLESARLFLEAGARVAIAGRNADKLRHAAEVLGGGDHLIMTAGDLAQADQAAAVVGEVTRRLGSINILVNNAGLNIKERTTAELTPDSWRLVLGGNLESAFYCMHAVLPQMRQRKDGLIICVNSISGKRASPLGGTAYIAAKFGLRGLAMGVAAEERNNGIRVSSIYPGEVDTPILEQRPTPITEAHRQSILKPGDVAAAVFFVASLPAHACVPELVITPANALYI
jgi:NAD(P)-dependent dehydrogenase (short-subunit alcohol dehydrogenase family)